MLLTRKYALIYSWWELVILCELFVTEVSELEFYWFLNMWSIIWLKGAQCFDLTLLEYCTDITWLKFRMKRKEEIKVWNICACFQLMIIFRYRPDRPTSARQRLSLYKYYLTEFKLSGQLTVCLALWISHSFVSPEYMRHLCEKKYRLSLWWTIKIGMSTVYIWST